MELILAVMLSRQVYVCDVPVALYRAVLFYGDFCWCKKKHTHTVSAWLRVLFKAEVMS